MGSNRKNIGEQSEPGGILGKSGERERGGHPFPSPDYLSARFARRFCFWPTPIFFSFFPQYGTWSQANFNHNQRLHSHKIRKHPIFGFSLDHSWPTFLLARELESSPSPSPLKRIWPFIHIDIAYTMTGSISCFRVGSRLSEKTHSQLAKDFER